MSSLLSIYSLNHVKRPAHANVRLALFAVRQLQRPLALRRLPEPKRPPGAAADTLGVTLDAVVVGVVVKVLGRSAHVGIKVRVFGRRVLVDGPVENLALLRLKRLECRENGRAVLQQK